MIHFFTSVHCTTVLPHPIPTVSVSHSDCNSPPSPHPSLLHSLCSLHFAPLMSSPSPLPTCPTPTPTPPPSRELEWQSNPQSAFELGTELAFERWEVLTMAVENGWCGGVEKGQQLREELIDSTIEWFLNANERLYWDEVSEFLYEALLNEFHVDAQDQSEEQVTPSHHLHLPFIPYPSAVTD